MKKIKKILIGTHNRGKFKEISYLLGKKIKKISPSELNIKSPKEIGKSFKANSELKHWKYEQIGRGIDKRNKQIVWKYRNHSQLQIEIN